MSLLLGRRDEAERCALYCLQKQVGSNGYQAWFASSSFGMTSPTFPFSSCSLDMATVVQSNCMLQGGRLGFSSALLGKVKQIQQNCTWVFNFLVTVQPMLLL